VGRPGHELTAAASDIDANLDRASTPSPCFDLALRNAPLEPPGPSAAATTPSPAVAAPAIEPAGLPLRVFLSRLIWLCLGPLLLLAAYLAIDRIRLIDDQHDIDANDLARGVAAQVDEDLVARIGALSMLAASPLADDALHTSDFYREAQGFVQSFGSHVVLADADLRMVLNTRVPLGAPLPVMPRPRGHAAVPMALASGKPAVGDLSQGPIAGESLVVLAVPVLRADQPRRVLLSTLLARQFQPLLDRAALPVGWTLALLDGNGSVIARRGPANLVSMPPGEGGETYQATTTQSPWSVQVGITAHERRAPLLLAAVQLLVAIVVATLAGVLGGTLATRRLARMVTGLSQERPAGSAPPAIREIAEVQARLD
jgi:hypothetical protein